ncbi:hypothetical protein JCM6882_005046 [Rhodosporidiobolus microsporus]
MGDIPVYAGHAPFLPMGAAVSFPPPPPEAAPPPPILISNSTAPASNAQPDTSKMKPCAVCRLRRVKCEREPGEVECKKCKERGLECRPAPTKGKGHFREGKRLKMAKEMYGTKDDLAPPSTGSSPAYTLQTPIALQTLSSASFSGHSTAPSPAYFNSTVSFESANTRLGTIELKSSVMSSFLDSFFKFKSITTFDGDINFQLTFDQAGRRVDQLSEPNQVLCGALLALGARCSDHPTLVGLSSSCIVDLTDATLQDVDLRSYGRMRGGAVADLTEQALQMADEKGVLRMTSPESVVALMLLEGLIGLDGDGFRQSSGYRSAYKEQIRQLLAQSAHDKSKRTIEGTILSWTAYVRDSLVSAFSGITPTFSDDDAWLLRGQEDPPPPLAELLLRPPLTESPEANYWPLIGSFTHHISDLARETPARLSGPRAMKAPQVDEAFVRDFVKRTEIALEAIPLLLDRAGKMNGSSRVMQDAYALVRTLRLGACSLALVLQTKMEARLSRRPFGAVLVSLGGYPNLSSGADEAYWARLVELNKEVEALFYKAAREVVAILEDALSSGLSLGTHRWLDSRSAEVLFTRLPLWVGAILRGPPGVAPELSSYQLDSKISDLSWFLRAMRSAGWSSERLVESYDWVASELAKLEALRNQQQYTLPPPTFNPSPQLDPAGAFPSASTAGELDLDALLGFAPPPLDTMSASSAPFVAPNAPAGAFALHPAPPPDPPALPPLSTTDLDTLLGTLGAEFLSPSSNQLLPSPPNQPLAAHFSPSPTSASSTSGSGGSAAGGPVAFSPAQGLQADFPDLAAQFPDLF